MAEPRQRIRQKGAQFPPEDLKNLLRAFGDDWDPLGDTVALLDEIITDFIIETCHAAAQCATYSHRAKIKVDDFKFALRKDPVKLGRVTELLTLDKEIKRKRKLTEMDEEAIAREERQKQAKLAKQTGQGPGRGRRKKVKSEADGS